MDEIIWKNNHKNCKNKDTECCPINSICTECYYYEDKLFCPNCKRELPHNNFRRKQGCMWCVPKKSTKYCTGKY